MALQRLKEAAEKLKLNFQALLQQINLPYIMPIDGIPQHLVKTLSRSQFEQMTDKLIQATIEPAAKH